MGGDKVTLTNGSRVAIIGGGPSGTSCAIKLLKEAKKKGLSIEVIIFESKDFSVHHNQCVGVLSPPIDEIFSKVLEIPFPSDIIKREIKGYCIHTDNCNPLTLLGSNGTYATRRILFDRYMLEKAKEYGAEVINSRVTGIEFYKEEEVRIYSESKFLRCDAVVAAFGLDEGTASIFELATGKETGYKRPSRSLDTIITKFHVDKNLIEGQLKSLIHAFLLKDLKKIEFGAITPKGDHIIINIAGRGVSSREMDLFLSHPEVKELLGEINFSNSDYFRGCYPIKPAKNIIGDRFIAVGDATGWIRPYKGKGINVALMTGAKAGEIMINSGISKNDLIPYLKIFNDLERDYIYGKLFRALLLFSLRTGFVKKIISIERMPEELREAIYIAVSGEGSYYEILKRIFSLRSARTLGVAFFKYFIRLPLNFIRKLQTP